jgi:two-component system CAI-1 autoinducer sensor kinase/phosphatase CqsS
MIAPLVPALHPSPVCVKALGVVALVGHSLSWFVWTLWLPQPYESLPLRLCAASLGLLLISDPVSTNPSSRLSGQVFTAVLWFELPFVFTWMFLCNGGSPVWLASMGGMILTYFFVTDWRIATVGIVTGGLAARLVYELFGPSTPAWSHELFWTSATVLVFFLGMGLLLGVYLVNLRRVQLVRTLATMGIMAHELRTPLATMALIGDAMRGSAGERDDTHARAKLEQLAMRLHTLVRNMNHQIDMQIANARLTRLPARSETLSAGELVASAVANYPFRSTREKDSVRVKVHADFTFRGSHALFSQVIDNLLKNALRSLAAAGNAALPGDLVIDVGVQQARGRIVVADRGIGIDPELQPRIFEPFFSTNRGTGHGLGLAFCHQVVHAARGTIRVKSQSGHGAVFTIELPISGRA